jgi:AraC-like DNA-binding protein
MPLLDLNAVRGYIDANLDAIVTVADVAAAFPVSARTLRRRFRQEESIPLGQYLTRRRIARMKRLLRTTGRTHRQIARAAGYRHPSTAARAFKRETGLTMTEYRERHEAT